MEQIKTYQNDLSTQITQIAFRAELYNVSYVVFTHIPTALLRSRVKSYVAGVC